MPQNSLKTGKYRYSKIRYIVPLAHGVNTNYGASFFASAYTSKTEYGTGERMNHRKV